MKKPNTTAEESTNYHQAEKADKAFRKAMYAAGYSRSTVTTPGTEHARIVRGEPAMVTRGTSPAAQCVEVGTGGGRGTRF